MAKVWLKSKLQKLAMKKKNAYVTRSVTLPRIDKDYLLARAADNSGVRRGVFYAAVDALCNEFKNFLLNGHSVEVPEIGSFRFAVNATASDEQPESAAELVYRRKIIYTPNKDLWRSLQAISLQDTTPKPEDEDEGGDEPEP